MMKRNDRSEMIKRNLERQRMREKDASELLKSVCQFLNIFLYLYVSSLKKNGKWLDDVLIFMPYLDKKYVYLTHTFMI